jgi:hypothetical protein
VKTKTVEYYESAIIRLKTKIKRLQAEKRVSILRQRERKQLAELTSKGGNDDR